MVVGRFYSRGATVDFSKGSQKDFFRGPKVVKFHFINSKLREQLFVLKIYQGNIKFQNPTAASFPSAPPLSDDHSRGHRL